MTRARLHWWPAYVGLGSNLRSPTDQVKRALHALAHIPESRLQLRSSLYRSAPVGPAGQPDYINAVAALLTRLGAPQLLGQLQAIEIAQGRERGAEPWGPRTLDLDLLVYGSEQRNTAELCLPHPRIAERNFVLWPLAEIAPDLMVPGLTYVKALAAALGSAAPAIERLTR